MSDEPLHENLSERSGGITRRQFAREAAAIGVAGIAAPAWMDALGREEPLAGTASDAAQTLEIAEYSQFFVGAEGVSVPRGTLANGMQKYVEYQIPARVQHPYPIVLVHGAGGQGSDWMSTPDGRSGWASYLLQEGYKVYLVDRPGQGRPPFEPQFHGAFTDAVTYEEMSRRYAVNEGPAGPDNPQAHLHTQWPGNGRIGDPALDQLLAAQGPSFANDAAAESVWRSRGAMLLDEIGPSILVTHGDSGPFGWVVADQRPGLVRAVIALEPSGPAFHGRLAWGLTAGPMTYEPQVRAPGELAKEKLQHPASAYMLQAGPARQLRNLAPIPIAIVTAEASGANMADGGTVAFLKQAGCRVTHLRLADKGIHGNGHFMMMEKNNRDVLRVLTDWLDAEVKRT